MIARQQSLSGEKDTPLWGAATKNIKFGRKNVIFNKKFGRKNAIFLVSSVGKM